jgi:hypothetical protein
MRFILGGGLFLWQNGSGINAINYCKQDRDHYIQHDAHADSIFLHPDSPTVFSTSIHIPTKLTLPPTPSINPY